MKVKIKKLHPDAVIPAYAHGPEEDAGMDLYAVEDVYLPQGVPMLVKCGISIELPPGFEAQIRSRSGMAFKKGISVLNSPGTIDPGFRGELAVILLRHSSEHQSADKGKVIKGDRIAQLVVSRYETVEFEESELAGSIRGVGGLGSTGV